MKQAPISGIYKILNKVTGDFYIGSSSNTRARWYNHKRALKHNIGHNAHLQNAWNKYSESSFEFHVLEVCSVSVLTVREQHYCDTLKPVYNKRKDCTNNTGAKLTRTPEANRKRQVESTLGKRVYQFDLEGNPLKEFPSIREAARTVGKGVSQLFGVLKGDRSTCGGFRWTLQKVDRLPPLAHAAKKIVLQYDLHGSLLREFPSAVDAAELLGKNIKTSIYRCCNGLLKKAGGYKWQYK